MKRSIAIICFLLLAQAGLGQVKIHSHNDYEQQQRFKLAYEQRVYQIEADVFEDKGELLVAHTKKSINPKHTLRGWYLKPIDSLFKLNSGRVSSDRDYTFSLMIDFKTAWSATFPVLEQQLKAYGAIFNRGKHKSAVQIVISGNRPPDSIFHTLPNWVFFDGLPGVKYSKKDLKRVTMISDNLKTYTKWNGIGAIPSPDKDKLQKVIDDAHRLNKPIRFWNAPDTEDCWLELVKLGVDIINTDRVRESKLFFEKHQHEL